MQSKTSDINPILSGLSTRIAEENDVLSNKRDLLLKEISEKSNRLIELSKNNNQLIESINSNKKELHDLLHKIDDSNKSLDEMSARSRNIENFILENAKIEENNAKLSSENKDLVEKNGLLLQKIANSEEELLNVKNKIALLMVDVSMLESKLSDIKYSEEEKSRWYKENMDEIEFLKSHYKEQKEKLEEDRKKFCIDPAPLTMADYIRKLQPIFDKNGIKIDLFKELSKYK